MELSDRLKEQRDLVRQHYYRRYRRDLPKKIFAKKLRWQKDLCGQRADFLQFVCEAEQPVVFADERICFLRTIAHLPRVNASSFWRIWQFDAAGKFQLGKSLRQLVFGLYKATYLKVFPRHPLLMAAQETEFSNSTPDYELLLQQGIAARVELAKQHLLQADAAAKLFLHAVIKSGETVIALAERYAAAAELAGNGEMAAILHRVPKYGAETFHEALQSLRLVSGAFVLSGAFQIGFGRLDQYLWPFYQQDLASGRLTREAAFELLAEFFIAINRDNDLCSCLQQGDNGLSLMLGGCRRDGTSGVNDLTYLVLEVAKELQLIDPKINLRIDTDTPLDLLQLGCELTRCGLGFPQYSNDEVVIPALVEHGYDLADARDYTVAACWEFLIPGKECGVVNQGAVSFPAAVDRAFRQTVRHFSEVKLRSAIAKNIEWQLRRILKYSRLRKMPAPLLSLFYPGCIEQGRDVTRVAKYINTGIHGAGSTNGADQLCAVLQTYEQTGPAGLRKLLRAEDGNFYRQEALQRHLENDLPKVGNDEAAADRELIFLFERFAEAAAHCTTGRNKIRPGSGSAMYYVWLAGPPRANMVEPVVGATADGRLCGTPFGASLAPAQGVKVNGILSVFKSFAKINYHEIFNGGPVTVELSHSVFNAPEGVEKLAKLIKYFVYLKNQQLQLNVLDVATLEDAVKHPELHRNLIVRVWGWSGYFCELAPEYQQHIINRHRYEL